MASSSSDSYRTKFYEFLKEDKAKRDFILGFLAPHYENVVDNLTTKDDLSYSDVKMRLHNLNRNTDSTSTAYKATETKKQKGKQQSSSVKECSYCKKHNPKSFKGHLWQDCNRLK